MASAKKRLRNPKRPEVGHYWVAHWVDGAGKRRRVQGFRTKAEAEAYAAEQEGRARLGFDRPEGRRLTVETLMALYIDEYRARRDRKACAPAYIAQIETLSRLHICPAEFGLSSLKLADVTAGRVYAFLDRLREAGRSDDLVKKVRTCVAGAFEFARSRDFLAENPARNVRIATTRDEDAHEKVSFPEKGVVVELIETERAELRPPLVAFAALTGCRASECYGARWADIDWESRVLQVRRRVDKFGNIGPTKTRSGRREVPLSSELLQILREWKLRSRFKAKDDFIFANERGKPHLHRNIVVRWWRPLTERAEVPYFNFHQLRHFAASLWIESGLQLKEVSAIIGHNDISTTANIYGHLFANPQRAAAIEAVTTRLLSEGRKA